MEFSEKITALMKLKKVSVDELADYLKVSSVSVRKWKRGEVTPRSEYMLGIAKKFETDVSYLLEDGSNSAKETSVKTKEQLMDIGGGDHVMIVPLVEYYAAAGYMSGWHDTEYLDTLRKHSIIVDKVHFGKYRAFRVKGDSMDNDSRDSISEGDVVTGRSIDREFWKNKLHLHRWLDYVIVHKDEGIVLKRIIKHDVDRGVITCHSLNEIYSDYEINLDDCFELYNIVRVEKSRGN